MSREIEEFVDPLNFDLNHLVFSKPVVTPIPNSTLSVKRIGISRNFFNSDGSFRGTGNVYIEIPDRDSWGVSENKVQGTDRISGYTMSITMWNKNATAAQKQITTLLENISEKCKDHLLTNKRHEDFKLYDLERSEMKKFSPLFWKKEEGIIVEGVSPTLYAKLIQSKATDKKPAKMITRFSDLNTGEEVDFMTLLGKKCTGNFAIMVESIFIGTKISLQIKLKEAQVALSENRMYRPLLAARAVVPAKRSLDADDFADDDVDEKNHSNFSRPQPDDDETSSLKADDDDDSGHATSQPVAVAKSVTVSSSPPPQATAATKKTTVKKVKMADPKA